VGADGLHQETVRTNLVRGPADIAFGGGFMYATTGDVLIPDLMFKVGTIPATGPVRPDAANGRVHFLNGTNIQTFHYAALTSIGTFSDPSLANHTVLLRWGSDGIAAGGGANIVLLRGSLVRQ
jgi:hypothetical protein